MGCEERIRVVYLNYQPHPAIVFIANPGVVDTKISLHITLAVIETSVGILG